MSTHAIFHDLENGSYKADIPVLLELVAEEKGTIVDVGAGTGRVTIPLIKAGHRVIAVDLDKALCGELLARQISGLWVYCQDARDLKLPPDERVSTIIAPLHLVQMLGPAAERARFYRAAREILHGGDQLILSCSVDDPDSDDAWDGRKDPSLLPEADQVGIDGVIYESQPIAAEFLEDRMRLIRERYVATDEQLDDEYESVEERVDEVWLLTPEQMAQEVCTWGFMLAEAHPVEGGDKFGDSRILIFEAC